MFSIDPIAFTFLGLQVHWYGVMISLGVLAASLIAAGREKRLGLPRDTTIDVLLWALPIAIVCARLYYVAFSWQEFAANPASIFDIRSGGLAIFGGLLGGIGAGLVFARVRRISVGALADLAAPGIAIGQAFGRWGNFFNQEAYGAPILNDALQFFPIGVYIEAKGGWFLATFFYESMWCLALCIALLIAERRKRFHRRGDALIWYALGYSCERVIVEGLRTDSLYMGAFRVSQLLSALLLLAAAAVFLLRERKPVYLFMLLPGAVLVLLILTGRASVPTAFVLSLLQLSISFFGYYKIRKKADKP